jgi:hypothetical protein
MVVAAFIAPILAVLILLGALLWGYLADDRRGDRRFVARLQAEREAAPARAALEQETTEMQTVKPRVGRHRKNG